MNWIKSLKAIWINRKAITAGAALVKTARGVKSGWKSWEFWVALSANVAAFAGTIQHTLDPQVGVIVMGIATAWYNIMRGVKKSQDPAFRSIATSSEFWMSILQELGKVLMLKDVEAMNPALTTQMSALVVAATGLAAKLGAEEPTDPKLLSQGEQTKP